MAELLFYQEGDNPLFGRTNNPWDLERTSGGGSGGEGAIIAAGGSPLGLGADIGGSIRTPAHFCGIQGLRPTSGRLSNLDSPPELFFPGMEAVILDPGPMARTVADLELAMQVLAAPGLEKIDSRIATGRVARPARGLAGGAADRRLRAGRLLAGVAGAAPRGAGGGGDPHGSRRDRRALRRSGPHCRNALLLLVPDGGRAPVGARTPARQPCRWQDQDGCADVAGAERTAPADRERARLGRGQPRLADGFRWSTERSAREYWRLCEERADWRNQFLAAMDAQKLDAIVCPPHTVPAMLHGATGLLYDTPSYLMRFNVLGMPAGSVAATRVRPGEETDRPKTRDRVDREARKTEDGSAGLPVGVQVAARHWREDVVLAVMAALEQEFSTRPDYPSRPPE